jgi:hypothetical protein
VALKTLALLAGIAIALTALAPSLIIAIIILNK